MSGYFYLCIYGFKNRIQHPHYVHCDLYYATKSDVLKRKKTVKSFDTVQGLINQVTLDVSSSCGLVASRQTDRHRRQREIRTWVSTTAKIPWG